MTRSLFFAAAGAILAVGARPAQAAPATGVSGAAPTANVKVLKPLLLTALRNLDFGTIVMGSTMPSSQTVSVTTSGRNCGTGTLTCSGTFATAQYQVNGSNNQLVTISASAPSFTLTGSNGGTLSMTPSYPPNVTLDNSGNPGATFEVGGTLTINPATPEGLYTGTIDITVSYQ